MRVQSSEYRKSCLQQPRVAEAPRRGVGASQPAEEQRGAADWRDHGKRRREQRKRREECLRSDVEDARQHKAPARRPSQEERNGAQYSRPAGLAQIPDHFKPDPTAPSMKLNV